MNANLSTDERMDLAELEAFCDVALPRLYGYFLLRTSGDVSVAEDLTQETFLALGHSLTRTDVPQPELMHWLFGIARNKLIDFYRRQTRWIPITAEWSDEIEAIPDDGAEFARVDDLDAVIRLLAPLPESQRIVMLLRYAEGLSIRESAEVLGKSEHAIESLLVRARTALRNRTLEETTS